MDSIFWTIKNNGAYILKFIRRQGISLLSFNEVDNRIRATKSKDLKTHKHQVLNEHGFIFAVPPPPALAHAQLCCICNASFKVKIML